LSHGVLHSLRVEPDAADPVLAQQQARFNALVNDVALWRDALADWKQRIERFRQAVEPVRRELHGAWREWTFALDRATLAPGLARAEREQLGELLLEAARALLEWEDDPEIAAVASRHGKGSFCEPSNRDDAAHGAGDLEHGEDGADDWARRAAAAADQRAERAARRRSAAALKRRSEERREGKEGRSRWTPSP